MRCEEIQIALLEAQKYPQEILPAEWIKHLETCPDCREVRELWQQLSHFPAPVPDPGLTERFRKRLAHEVPQTKRRSPLLAGWGLPLAATLLLAVGGAFAAGYSLRPLPTNPRREALAEFRRGTAADRLQTIALVTSNRSGDSNLVMALLERVALDPSVEVRLSAVEALYIFGSDPSLGDRIAEALPSQDQPRVQLALVDLMVALRERRAAEALRRLVQEHRLGPAARHHAEARLAEQRM